MCRPLLALILAAAALTAADTAAPTAPAATTAKPAADAAVPGMPEVEGVSREDLLKFRRAAAKTAANPEIKAAREKIQELRKQAEFASDDEKKSLRSEVETTVDKLVELTRAAIAQADPSLSKETIVKVSEAFEKQQRARAQEANKKAMAGNGKAFPGSTDAKPAVRDPQADKKTLPTPPAARGAVQVPQVDGVSPEDTAKFKAALGRAYQDADWKAARTKLQELTAKTQFLTGSERADMQPDFEKAIVAMRTAMRAAVAKVEPSLSEETIAKISEAMEQNMRNGRGK
jgi:predicted HicB family RNase H-like nuclease